MTRHTFNILISRTFRTIGHWHCWNYSDSISTTVFNMRWSDLYSVTL